MMRLLIILLISTSTLKAVNYVEIRTLFAASPNSETTANSLLEKTKNSGSSSPVELGYHGGALMAMANHCYLPTSKLSYFNSGKKELEKAIAASPKNAELRFIRFSIQCNVPAFLGYSSNIAADKTILINYLKSAQSASDADLKARIKNFLLQSTQCTETEKNSIRKL
ncbi:MAG: hypothetical protein ACKOXB_09335 [Flavobacteriales bacterium]